MRKLTSKQPSKSSAAEHCASERLKRSMLVDELKRRKIYSKEFREYEGEPSTKDEMNLHKKRSKRWLPEEVRKESLNCNCGFS